jgi:hypothetical protein
MVIWVSCPSTHTVPSRSIHFATLVATARTGQGFSAEFGGAGAVTSLRRG